MAKEQKSQNSGEKSDKKSRTSKAANEGKERMAPRSNADRARKPTDAEVKAEKGKAKVSPGKKAAKSKEPAASKSTSKKEGERMAPRSNADRGRKTTSAESKAKETQTASSGSGRNSDTDTTLNPEEFNTAVGAKSSSGQENSVSNEGLNVQKAKESSSQVEAGVPIMGSSEITDIKEETASDKLVGVSDIRRAFHKNEEPLYFISATNFNLLGADEWIKGFKFICYIECFDGLHPNVFSPKKEIPHDDFEGIEDINNYLLQHPEVQDYIKTRSVNGKAGKAMFLMFNEKTEELAEKLGLEIMFPKAEMRTFLDNKVNTNRIAERAGVACVPYVLSQVRDYEHLTDIAKDLGSELVIQTPFGDSGHTTFFISNEEEFNKHGQEIIEEDEVKIMKRIRCRGSAIEACVTRHGTIVAPLMTELVGFKELTPYEGGWCGNEIYPNAFTPELRAKAIEYTQLFGNQLRKEGYKGYFELDFLIDQDNGEIYLGELNPRVTGASSITNHAVFALADAPLFVFHILEWMGIDYDLDVDALNKRWARQENIDGWSQLIVKHTEDTIEYVTDAPKSGIWRMYDTGHIEFDRMDTHRRAVENENEAFFLRISKKGDYLYEGADMGILVTRGRMMTDDFKLNNRAKHWLKAIRSQFKSEMVEDKKKPKLSGTLTK